MELHGHNFKRIRDYSQLIEGKTYIIKYAGLFVIDELVRIQHDIETNRTVYVFSSVGKITDLKAIYPFDVKKITEIDKRTRLNEGKPYIVKLCGYKQILKYSGIYTNHKGKTGFEFYGRGFERKVLIPPEDLQAWSYN